MPHRQPTRVAFLGSGNIANGYAAGIDRHPELTLLGVFDLDQSKRDAFASEHACASYGSLAELAADAPAIAVNLTPAPYHYAATRDLIAHGLHVFSEKPVALDTAQARELVALASAASVRLACAPSVWLGRAALAAARALEAGDVGTVRLVNAEVSQGRIESWHPAPRSFYQVGPVVDAGIYPLAYLTALLGPVRSVSAVGTTVLSHRRTIEGESFSPDVADAWVAVLTFASGPLLRLSCNFYVGSETVGRAIDFHGDSGSLRLADWIMPGSPILRAGFGQPFTVSDPGDSTLPIDWSLGLADLAAAIAEDRPHRTGAEHAVHVVDILVAIERSAGRGETITIHSDFPAPYGIPQLRSDLLV